MADDGAVAKPFGKWPGPAVVLSRGDVGAVRVPRLADFGTVGGAGSISIASGSPFIVSSAKAWYFGRDESGCSCVFEDAFRGAFGRFVASDARRGDDSLGPGKAQCGSLKVSAHSSGANFVAGPLAGGKLTLGGGPGGGGGMGYDCGRAWLCENGEIGGGPID